MFKLLERSFGFIGKKRLDNVLDEFIADAETQRNAVRKKSIEDLDKLDPVKQGEKVADVLTNMNNELSRSYEQEIAIREFVDKLR